MVKSVSRRTWMRASIAAQLFANCLCRSSTSAGFSAPLKSGTNADANPADCCCVTAVAVADFFTTFLRFAGRGVDACPTVSSSWPKMKAT